MWRQQALSKVLAPEELAVELVTLREGVSADKVPVARRALKAFVERVVMSCGSTTARRLY
jgi:hypothetical protein